MGDVPLALRSCDILRHVAVKTTQWPRFFLQTELIQSETRSLGWD